MVSYKLNVEADKDLYCIYEYGVLSFGLNQADRYYDGLVDRFEQLTEQPYLYQSVDYIREGYRRSVYGSHSIYYRIEGNTVEIMRILGQQNIDTSF